MPTRAHDAGAAGQESPHRIYFTRVMHRRLFPVQYRFEYRVFSLLLDLDRLDQVPQRLAVGPRRRLPGGLLRPALFRFDPADRGPRDGSALRPWAERMLAAQGIDLAGGRIRLLCFPRLLGFGFNPLSLWYCEHADGRLRAVIAEVSNTFGQHHSYLLHDGGRPIAWPLRAEKLKCFYVSPLMDMDGGYRFRLSEPDDRLAVLIRQFDAHGRLKLVASQSGPGEPLTDAALWRAFRRMPVMTYKVVLAIHWQALKIWLRGARFFPKPEAPKQEVT
ncbi:hypothetical protein CKO31_13255 [Thiohalocapsa halophila]|uniref:DUF1365 domain-containing protein n=1 Tax=Thiohalocapsa halophila TaxID=69359 RepID=A0ABS1CIG5_9GAMM|nr:DUF1365 domain-containing protein [Thiohalocapsa halophila]MBK1631696.1 hypothetical protein [Thiohalocapsa halophila]